MISYVYDIIANIIANIADGAPDAGSGDLE